MPDQTELERLTEEARAAASIAAAALELDDYLVRREAHRAYGAALNAIRALIPNKNAFNAHLRNHNLLISTTAYRSDAMWMAKNWDDLQLTIDRQ